MREGGNGCARGSLRMGSERMGCLCGSHDGVGHVRDCLSKKDCVCIYSGAYRGVTPPLQGGVAWGRVLRQLVCARRCVLRPRGMGSDIRTSMGSDIRTSTYQPSTCVDAHRSRGMRTHRGASLRIVVGRRRAGGRSIGWRAGGQSKRHHTLPPGQQGLLLPCHRRP